MKHNRKGKEVKKLLQIYFLTYPNLLLKALQNVRLTPKVRPFFNIGSNIITLGAVLTLDHWDGNNGADSRSISTAEMKFELL